MAGPAATSWQPLPLAMPIFTDLASALKGADVLLSGTGWATDLEHQARKLARSKGIRNVAVLDHWVNYAERFVREGEQVLPDEIFVTDEYARCEAERCFPAVPVSVHDNLYLQAQLSELAGLEHEAREVLYLLEPIRADWPRNMPGEFEALDYFVSRWGSLGIPASTSLRLRPHPSDPAGKYAEWMAKHKDLSIFLDDSRGFAQALVRARWVAGCETNAMTIALAAGRTVISSLPPWAPPCRLPHEGIIRLSRIE